MADQILLSAGQRNLQACVRLAEERGLGVEMMTFAFPDLLDGDWKAEVRRCRDLLRNVPGLLSLHGPFMDMAPGSPDRRINDLCGERYRHALHIAAELNVKIVVLHANFIAAIHTFEYRVGWHKRNLDFWGPLALEAWRLGVTIAVENMWEYDPTIIGNLVAEIDHPNLRCCLDVGHAHLFGEVPFIDWLAALHPLLVHTHLNNNDGKIDIHMGLDHGVLDYRQILPRLRALPSPPSMTLEMDEVDFMLASLPYLDLPMLLQPSPDA